MSAPKGPRPITRAFEIVGGMQETVQKGLPVTMVDLNELAQVLAAIDASSTHQDSGRKRRKPTKATAGKSQRKSRSVGAKKAAFDAANE